VYGRLDLIGNDELDGGGFERVLWIEPNHEVKNLVLEKMSKKCPISEAGGKGRGARWGRSRCKITSSGKKKRHLVQTFPKNLYRKKPCLEIISLQ
jgi:hypothetical protein